MALENQILDRLVAITNTLNAIQANSKRTEEFPHLEPLDNDGKIRVSVDGVSFWIAISEISSLIDALGFDVINFGFDLANNTAGNSTTSQEIVDYINSIGFTVNTGNLIQLSIVVKKNDSYYIKKYNFSRNNITGNWGTDFENGEINISDLVETGEIFIGNVPSGLDDVLFNLGDIGSDSIFDYLNNRNTALDPYRNLLDDGSIYYFSAIINDDNQIYKYVGSLPKTIGQGQDVLVFSDFDLISNDATFTPTGGYTGTAQDIVDLFNNYLPLTGGTLTGPLSATNFETEKGIEFLSNIEISKLIASGELAVRITDTGVPIYVFNETGIPTNPKDVITKEFFDANAGDSSDVITLVMSSIEDDLETGICKYIYTVPFDCKIQNYWTTVQESPMGSVITARVLKGSTHVDSVGATIQIGNTDSRSNPPTIITDTWAIGDKLSVEITSVGTTRKGKCLTINLEVEKISAGTNIPVNGVSVDPNTYSLVVGDTVQLSAVISPSNATDKTGVWSSSDDNVATVNSSGLVTATGFGNATITFTSNDGGFQGNCSIITSVNKYYVRPSGQSYGDGSGTSYENAWSGLSNINWASIGAGNTLSVCGNYSETFSIQNNDVIIDFNDADEAAYFDMTGVPTGVSISGKTGVIVNNPRVDNATVQNFIITNSTVIINDGDCNNSGNQSFQTMGDSHVTYNNIKSHGNADESISIHDNGTLILNGNIDFQNNAEAGINLVGTSKLIINGECTFSNNAVADIRISGSNTNKELLTLTINNQGKLDNFGKIIVQDAYSTINLNGGTYSELRLIRSTLNANKALINSISQPSGTHSVELNIIDSVISNHSVTGGSIATGIFYFKNSRINTSTTAITYRGPFEAERCLFYNLSNSHLLNIDSNILSLNYCLFVNPIANSYSIAIRTNVTSAVLNNLTIDGRGAGRGVYSQIDATINNAIIVNTTNSAINASGSTITANNSVLHGNAVNTVGTVVQNDTILQDPLFIDPINLDYSLDDASPALGEGITTDNLTGIFYADWNSDTPIVDERNQTEPFDIGAIIK